MTQNQSQPKLPELSPEAIAERKKRSMWTALILFGFVALIFAITITKLGENADVVARSRDFSGAVQGSSPAAPLVQEIEPGDIEPEDTEPEDTEPGDIGTGDIGQ